MSSFQALISVYDKTGIVNLAQSLQSTGASIISTGGTYKTLEENGVKVNKVEDVTHFPEILGGRVKTLHPFIHGSILAKPNVSDHQKDLATHAIHPTQLVVVNLYPFSDVVAKPDVTIDTALENIDIGGHTLLRAAAKNFSNVVVIVDPSDYQWIAETIKEKGLGGISEAERRSLALKAFRHTSSYDAAISEYLVTLDAQSSSGFPEHLAVSYHKKIDLRYGENPHQKAALYVHSTGGGIASADLLQGQPLSYNNILDADAALRCIKEFEHPGVVIVKHTNPCGFSLHESQKEAYVRALSGDPVSAYGGIVGFNRPLTRETVEAMKGVFYEVVVAPDYEPNVLELLSKRAKLRVLRIPNIYQKSQLPDIRTVSGGVLLQTSNDPISYDDKEATASWKVMSKVQPTEAQISDLLFAWRISKHVKSNAIVLASEKTLLGMGAGQPNRVQSIELSIKKAGERSKGSVLASDAFMPFEDNIEIAVQGGVVAVVQPGGSIRDEEVIKAADKHGIALVFTGSRNFLH